MTMAPAAATLGASSLLAAPPLEKRAMSMPEKSAVAESSTVTSSPLKGSVVPAERADAKNRTCSSGKSRSSRRARMTPPT